VTNKSAAPGDRRPAGPGPEALLSGSISRVGVPTWVAKGLPGMSTILVYSGSSAV
jgi:hypothetical protein